MLARLSRARLFSKPQQIGVIGMGLMGHGIVQTAAAAGFDVVAIDSNSKAVDGGMSRITKSVSKIVEKQAKKAGGTPEALQAAEQKQAAIMSKIKTSTSTQDLAQCDLIIEAIIEDLNLKRTFYKDLSQIVKSDAVVASNTSSFPIGELATAFGRGEQVCGLHFFNPVQIMKLVEVVRCDATSDSTFQTAWDFVNAIGKAPVECKDTPGFIVNRLLVPYIASALAMLDRGDAAARDIDTAMCFGASMPMGPIHLADYVGLDTCLFVLQGWVEAYPNDPAFYIPQCLKEKVQAGNLGRKTGEGFYKWDGDKPVHMK
eukprot:TRINITY_DN52123_c0_g1_i1.p2 TRINITY_DN52123_c0_g1~~TRINITY_DN52123_c0_g1_i1.p2  ORF type:complete len:315 (-),score=54.16 TRINITY_DN52123_c0_g1_i1:1807-2751(-)